MWHLTVETKKKKKIEIDTLLLLVDGDRRVTRHEEMAPRSGHERRNNADEVVVHVAGITKRGG